jgi:hypothetical protein
MNFTPSRIARVQIDDGFLPDKHDSRRERERTRSGLSLYSKEKSGSLTLSRHQVADLRKSVFFTKKKVFVVVCLFFARARRY